MLSTKALSAANAVGGAVYVEDVFSTYLYTGTAATITINNGIDLSGNGGLVWLKSRSGAAQHALLDSARGITNGALRTDGTGIPNGATILDSLNNNGFTIDQLGWSYSNTNGTTYASWSFRKAEKFFDVVTYTGNGTDRTIAHSLGSVPGCIIVKKTSAAQDWLVYHRSLGADRIISLNSTAGSTIDATTWNNTTPTSTAFSVGATSDVNNNGATYVAYLFAHDAGGFGDSGSDNVITCGSFSTGTGNVTVNLGYEPQWIMYKRTNGAGNWVMFDTMRGWYADASPVGLIANDSFAEPVGSPSSFVTSTGFNVSGSASQDFVYIAIRRGPMKTPEAGTEVFDLKKELTGDDQVVSVTPSYIDLIFTRRYDQVQSMYVLDRMRGGGLDLQTASTSSETATRSATFSLNKSISVGGFGTSSTNISLFMKRAPGFFDVVCYTGNSSSAYATQSITHNLGVVPELIIIKGRTTTDAAWLVGYNFTPSQFDNGYLYLTNASNPIGYNIAFFGAAPTSTTFTVTNQVAINPYVNNSNWSGNNYVAYLFATCSGVSKVGSYTGTGTTQQINCGFTGGARFVLIKRTDSTGDWYLYDSARGIVAGNDPYLLLNSTAAEVTNTDYVDTYAQGFEISSTAPAAINANGGTFIFLSIA